MEKVDVIVILIFKSELIREEDFLNLKPIEIIKDLEIGLHNILKDLNYTIKDLLEMKEEKLLSILKTKVKIKTFYISLKEEIKKRSLNIDLKNYSAFKNNEALK